MKWKLVLVVSLVWLVVGADLLACGNKFFVPSRGTRFSKVPIVREAANILVYAPPNSALSKALGDIPVATILTEVGYKPTTVSGVNEFDSALRRGGWDLVLADLADTASLRSQLQESGAPTVLPVLHRPSRRELADAEKTYGQALRSPIKSQRFIETVDYVVASHVAERATEDSRSATE